MITVYNANNLAQQWFFQRAYAHLEAENLLPDASKNEQKTFLSLEGYFANIGNLINLRTEYALIPSDEEPFEINANTRSIKIPNAFTKGVAIAGDDMSEVITFTIDRYFDYVDLAGTNVCVQWELPGENGGTGISKITMIDLETIPGKIRFGWPLTDKLTQYAGKVNFAVRFYVENKEQSEHNPSAYNYVLNTSPAVITILPGLNIVNPTFAEENIDGEFLKFVQNSQNPGLPRAESPKWTDYREGGVGKDLRLDSPAAINADDTLVLKAQAQVADNGYIKYQWYFKEGGVDSEFPAIAIGEEDKRFTISNQVYEKIAIPANGKRVVNEQYYVKNTEDGVDTYSLHIGDLDPQGEYYERFTTLTINKSVEGDADYQRVTGAYWVSAENFTGVTNVNLDPEKPELGSIPAMNYSTPQNSSTCIVPSPEAVTILVEPANTVFINNGSVALSVQTSEDVAETKRTYTWYCNNTNSTMDFDESKKVTNDEILVSSTPGWYYVNIDSQLNRTVENAKSSHPYRVVNEPVKPSLKLEYCNWSEVLLGSEEEQNAFLADENNWHVVDENNKMESNVATRVGDVIRLRVTPYLGEEPVSVFYPDGKLYENLFTDGVSYKWFIIPVDTNPTEHNPNEGILINKDSISDYSDESNNSYIKFGSPYDTNYLDVLCKVNDTEIASYYCEVTNTLDSKSATFGLADYDNIFNIW